VFPRAIRIATIGGVAVRVDPSWIGAALLSGWSFWSHARISYGHGTLTSLGFAIAGALLLFGSVLAHELAHALEGRHRGMSVGAITLFLFGGVTETSDDAKRPADAFSLAAIGPWTSVVLAAFLGLVSAGSELIGLGVVAELTGVLAWLNLGLAIFNMLPGIPLDGGRVLHAIVWRVTGDKLRATRVAGRAGQGIGAAVLFLGVRDLLFAGNLANGLILSFIGWFLVQGATAELAAAEATTALADRTVGSVSAAPVYAVPAATSVARLADELQRLHEADALLVDEGTTTVGVVMVDDVLSVPLDARPTTSAASIMLPIAAVPTVRGDEPATAALAGLREDSVLAVVDGTGEVVGLLTARQLTSALERARVFAPLRPRRGITRSRAAEATEP